LDEDGDQVLETKEEISDGRRPEPWLKPRLTEICKKGLIVAAAGEMNNANVHLKVSEAAGGPLDLYN
jgi:hypothetical protein